VEEFYTAEKYYHNLIITLYQELYYRHLFDKVSQNVTIEDRKNSWNNYSLLLDYFISDQCPGNSGGGDDGDDGLLLPAQWLWDMLDEYVYQFQDTQRWRCRKAKEISENESAMTEMKEFGDKFHAWEARRVLDNLQQLMEVSGIREHLQTSKDDLGRNPADIPTKLLLGYFAMISLLRLHIIMGDYQMALGVVSDLDYGARALYLKVPACHITLFYNIGFAYMMTGRYQDAIRNFSTLLLYITRNRSYTSSHSYQQETMNRLIDKMYLLTILCNALSPNRLDESISQHIKDKHPDKVFKLQQDDEEVWQDTFCKACPKFIDPSIPSYESKEELRSIDPLEPQDRQLASFLRDVRFQRKVSEVRSFAKLYNNISMAKLASLMDLKSPDALETVRSELLCAKHRGRQQVWRAGNLGSGDHIQTQFDGFVDFYLEQDMIHVKNSKNNRTYSDWFVKQISKTQDLLSSLQQAEWTAS